MTFKQFCLYLLISIGTITFSLYTILGEAWPLIMKVILMYVTFMCGHYGYLHSAITQANRGKRRRLDDKKVF